MNESINIRDLTFCYEGGVPIFDHASFYAYYGEVTLVAGHSGSGKSTLLSIVSGIIPNVNAGELSGEVIVAGKSIIGAKMADICRQVGVVLQNAEEQIINKYVEDEVSFPLENLAFKPSDMDYQIDAVLSLMHLDRRDRTHTLSGGQKQRLITASTLAMGQRIIVLDEPLANLDKDGAHMLMTTLRKLAKNGYSVVVVEHRLDMVLPYVDNVWHVGDGAITRVDDTDKYLVEQSRMIADTCPHYNGGEALFSLDDVHFGVKNKSIIEGISLDIERGSRVLLLGENGSGKTTLLRLIARLYKPTKGRIHQYIDDSFDRCRRGNRRWYKRVGVVYQNPDYQLFMPTVERELSFGATSHDYAMEMAERFGLEGLLGRHPSSLSEGQKRRVSIAAVLATRPEVLLLDEPTVGQDYEGLNSLVDILDDIHNETGNTMITVTHDVRAAEALCDRAYLIDKGRLIDSGDKSLVRYYFAGNTREGALSQLNN